MQTAGNATVKEGATTPATNQNARDILKARKILEGGFYKSFYPFKFLKKQDGIFIFISLKSENWFLVSLDGEVTCRKPPTQKKKP